MDDDQEQIILTEIEQEGYDDAVQGQTMHQAPYKRDTTEWWAWRMGWAYGAAHLQGHNP